MKRIAIIANKSAGRGDVTKHILSARAGLWGRSTEFFFPANVADLQRQVSELACRNDHDAIVVIGGDGTVNHAIRNFPPLAANNVPLFVFPGGTANDLASELNLRADWTQVQSLVDRQVTSFIDLIEVNGVPFSTVAGVGVGASLTSEFNSRRKSSTIFKTVSGALHSEIYTLLTAKTVLLQRDYIHHLRIRASGFDEKIKTPAVFVCNQARLGGDIAVAPGASNTDHRFNVVIITSRSKTRLLAAIAELKRGSLNSDSISFAADEMTLTDIDGRPIKAFGDGETLAHAKKLQFKIRPHGLQIFRDPRGGSREGFDA